MIPIPPGATPQDLVPGDPDALEHLAARIARYAASAQDAERQVRRLDPEHWTGDAAVRFRAAVSQVPEHLVAASTAFGHAERSLRGYAGTLRQAQRSAAYALELSGQADAASAEWHAGGAVGPDPGEDDRAAAQRLLDAAHERVEAAARAAAGQLSALARSAPAPALGAVGSVRSGDTTIHAVSDHSLADQGSFAHGAGSGTTDLRYGAAHHVGFADGTNGGTSWESWVGSGQGRGLGDVPAGLLAGSTVIGVGVLGVAAIARRRRRTAMAVAGVDPAQLAASRPARARAIGGIPARIGAGRAAWRTNLASAPRSLSLGRPLRPGAAGRATDVPVVVNAPSVVRHEGSVSLG